MSLTCVLEEIWSERKSQDAKWGIQNHPNGTGLTGDAPMAIWAKETCDEAARDNHLTFRDILREEVAEAFAEYDTAKLRAELIQVAAVAVAWIEKLDRHAR